MVDRIKFFSILFNHIEYEVDPIQAIQAWEREGDRLPWVSKTQPTANFIKPLRGLTHEHTQLNLHKSKKLLLKNYDKVI
ncbi:MAG: hypothetical protein A2161_10860 [Candidatus Schekmanbacteria bacterium RBG_13_48_7]|uniref:Uncharacterized protein n=1 Tax=Candidatus Schekmanbacteria bacterium RBG_13_48_7 TaxID=1817878 RepID=A0A1F7RQI6_9BACT|nr:MAG: hypothetical protein A2161_10860 [Candidatus Schekmanbacteria bacterium RBG_13_48_7]